MTTVLTAGHVAGAFTHGASIVMCRAWRQAEVRTSDLARFSAAWRWDGAFNAPLEVGRFSP
jgi:hypothetical protein